MSQVHCVVCCRPVSPPCLAVRFLELNEREQTACSLINENPDFMRVLARGQAVICRHCLRYVRRFLANSNDASENQGADTAASDPGNRPPAGSKTGDGDGSGVGKAAVVAGAAVLGGAATILAAPLVVAAIGFGSGGIAAGSMAAGMMSSAWTTGVGVGVVSTLQSVGAAGLGATGTAVLGTAGGAVGAGVGGIISKLRGKQEGSGSGGRTARGAGGQGKKPDDDDGDDGKPGGKGSKGGGRNQSSKF